MSSENSLCSSLRISVNSATSLSRSFKPAERVLISSFNVERPSSASAIAISKSSTLCPKPFFLSSASSNALAQYSFLLSSSTCSFCKVATRLSIILMTLSSPTFWPCNAMARKPNSGCLLSMPAWFTASRSNARACSRWRRAADLTWTKLADALGNVCLNKSSASSSLRSLMVSAIASNSSLRVFSRSAHSSSFVLQLFSKSA
mmetsp:Transcript_29759/g.74799  ORF Transcript_29759/g.74799 Transcript_29759/m.74799 type:complete len:203 (-) Transcript_29759:1009-1617(-)